MLRQYRKIQKSYKKYRKSDIFSDQRKYRKIQLFYQNLQMNKKQTIFVNTEHTEKYRGFNKNTGVDAHKLCFYEIRVQL